MANSPANANYYPLPGFSFRVVFKLEDGSDPGDIAFQSVSGLNVQMQTETIKEGGENRFEHVVPVRAKYSDLVLKRGILSTSSKVTRWIKAAMENFEFKPTDIDVELLNENQETVFVWHLSRAWPKSWKVGDLNAERGEVLIETLEITYNNFRMQN